MPISWRKRLKQQPSLKNLENWPFVDASTLPQSKRKKYNRNRRIIASVLSGRPQIEIASEFNVSSSYLSYLLNRCLGGAEYEDPSLTTALIPDYHIKTHRRKTPLSRLSDSSGESCSFTYLLETVPNLKENLDAILKASIKRSAHGQNLKPKFFHAEFKRLLIEANWPATRYPFNQAQQAYESVRKYFHHRMNEMLMPNPKKKKRMIIQRELPKLAFQEIQIDSQIQDLTTSIDIVLSDELKPLRLSRVALLIAKDVATDCNVSYHLCLSKDPNQHDVIELLRKIHRPWKPLHLTTPELKYEPGAKMPVSLGNEYQHVGLGMIRLDNALCHVAHSIRDFACEGLGATLNLGLPAHPKGRNFVEYAFKMMSEQTHRFPSTTGSHTQDPIKETKTNLKKTPVVTLQAFEEILSVLISAHNVRPQPRLGGESPLAIIQYQMERFPLQFCFNNLNFNNPSYLEKKLVKVKWYKRYSKKPFINFQSLRYEGSGLHDASLIEKEIIIEYDPFDIRTINASTKLGQDLGKLYAPRTWQRFAHSIATRKRIFALIRKQRFSEKDPLVEYFNYLLQHKELPKTAIELVRIFREFGIEGKATEETIISSKSLKSKTSFLRFKQKPKRIPNWSTRITRMEHRE